MNAMSSRKARCSTRVPRALLLAGVVLCSGLPARSQVQLPEGKGKELVESRCTLCHGLDELVGRVNLNREDWQDRVNQMVAYGAPLSKDEIAEVTDYLARNFAGPGKPAGVVIRGPIEARINEVPVRPGLRPSESLFAPDGSIWFTTGRPLLGRYDPQTGQFKEYPFKNPNSRAHSMAADHVGNVWFTAQNQEGIDYVGRLNPKTGEITEYPMPDPKARQLHSLIVDQKGNVWFTMVRGDMVGKVIPKTGEVKLAPVPTPDSSPYDIQVNSKGIPFFSEFYTNKVASIDPDTMAIREYVLANPGTRPKRIGFTPDDVLWYADYARGYLGRLNPKTGETKEWPSPGGRRTQPYGLTVSGDIVWYTETNTKPPTVVRFDTKIEKFQTWLLPSAGDQVHDMVPAPDGNVWISRSTVKGGVIDKVEIRSGGR